MPLPRNALDFHRFTRPKIQKPKFHMHRWKNYIDLLPSLLTLPDLGGHGMNTHTAGEGNA